MREKFKARLVAGSIEIKPDIRVDEQKVWPGHGSKIITSLRLKHISSIRMLGTVTAGRSPPPRGGDALGSLHS